MSLRSRVALVMALGLALALLLQGLLGYFTFTRLVLNDIDRDLSEFTRQVTATVMQADDLKAITASYEGYVVHARLIDQEGGVTNLTPFPAEVTPQRVRPGIHTVGPWRVTQVTLGWNRRPLTLQTALTSPEFTAGLHNHRVTMLFSALVVTLLGASAAYALSGYALRPLQGLTRISSRIAESGSLHEQVAVAGHSSGEIHDLALAFNRMLQRLSEFRSREATFNRQAAHELRTPLTAMRLSLDAALAGYADPRETLEALDHELRRTQRLTTSILILAREGRLASAEQLDLAALAQSCASRAGATYQGLGTAWIMGDEGLLRRALENLLENAARHAPGAPVLVSVRLRGGQDDAPEVSVQDWGPGLPDETLPHLTREFYRVGKPKTGEASSGLGLSAVQHVMTAHQGSVHLENTLPHGLKVTLRFPGLAEMSEELKG